MEITRDEKLRAAIRKDKALQYDALKGRPITLPRPDGEGTVKLTLGSLNRTKEALLEDGEGSALKMGEIQTPSGHRFHAILDVSPEDSGEHMATYVVGLYREDDADGGRTVYGLFGPDELKDWTDAMKEIDPSFVLIPYAYKYRDRDFRDFDHHVDPKTGWSSDPAKLGELKAKLDAMDAKIEKKGEADVADKKGIQVMDAVRVKETGQSGVVVEKPERAKCAVRFADPETGLPAETVVFRSFDLAKIDRGEVYLDDVEDVEEIESEVEVDAGNGENADSGSEPVDEMVLATTEETSPEGEESEGSVEPEAEVNPENGTEENFGGESEASNGNGGKVSDATLKAAAHLALLGGRISEEDYRAVLAREMTLDEAVRRVKDGEAKASKKNGTGKNGSGPKAPKEKIGTGLFGEEAEGLPELPKRVYVTKEGTGSVYVSAVASIPSWRSAVVADYKASGEPEAGHPYPILLRAKHNVKVNSRAEIETMIASAETVSSDPANKSFGRAVKTVKEKLEKLLPYFPE